MTECPIEFPLQGDFYYSVALTNPQRAPATGLMGLTAYLSNSAGGPTINAGLVYGLTETSTLGTYDCTFLGTALEDPAILGPMYVNRDGFISVVSAAGEVLATDAVHFVPTQRVRP